MREYENMMRDKKRLLEIANMSFLDSDDLIRYCKMFTEYYHVDVDRPEELFGDNVDIEDNTYHSDNIIIHANEDRDIYRDMFCISIYGVSIQNINNPNNNFICTFDDFYEFLLGCLYSEKLIISKNEDKK